VTIRGFVRRLLDRGADDADPDELVELVVLKLPRVPRNQVVAANAILDDAL
jgi:hypothetical protein